MHAGELLAAVGAALREQCEKEERARIARWLRAQRAGFPGADVLADRLERGEHLK